MKIHVEAHGCQPSFGRGVAGQPRIAFLNTASGSQLGAQRVSEDLLLITADDYQWGSVPTWIALLLKSPLSALAKQFVYKQNSREGFPSAPLSMRDANAVISFHAEQLQRGVDQLTVSCEYGRSRSVTAATVLRHRQQGLPLPQDKAVPNGLFNALLVRAARSAGEVAIPRWNLE